MKNTGLKAPSAQAKPKEIITHNHVRVDNYYWLNEPKNPEVISYLIAENTYLDAVMTPVKTLKEKLFQEIKGRIKEQDESVPVKDGNTFIM